jgi:intracellular multiplication protein IcmS
MTPIGKKMTAIAEKQGWHFSFKGRVLTYQEVFSEEGLLPGLTKRSDQLASLCFGYGLGATYEDVEQSLLGARVLFDSFTPDILRMFCITDSIFELMRGRQGEGAIAMDELLYD